jgi:hypothetical protein
MSKNEAHRPVGRPLKFASVEELQTKIDAYFAECDPHWKIEKSWREKRNLAGKVLRDEWEEYDRRFMTDQIPYTITGLALELDTSRETLLDYESGKYDNPEFGEELTANFSDTIKKAKLKIHSYAERRLDGNNPTGTIFSLKNNFNWVDKTEVDANVDHTSKGEKVEAPSSLLLSDVINTIKSKTADAATDA